MKTTVVNLRGSPIKHIVTHCSGGAAVPNRNYTARCTMEVRPGAGTVVFKWRIFAMKGGRR